MSNREISDFPKVLVVAHNPFSLVHNNGKTLAAFFRNWPQEKIAQIYLTTDVPDFSICRNFFQIHDIDMMRQIFGGRGVKGRRVMSCDIDDISDVKRRVKGSFLIGIIRSNFFPVFQLAKDVLWGMIGFKSKELMKFIDEFEPQVVFFHSYRDVFSFSLVNWICGRRKVALMMYVSDDYVSGRLSFDPFFWIQRIRVKQEYKKAISRSSSVVAGSEKMMNEFKERFGGNYIVAMNAISELNFPPRKFDCAVVRLLFAGNIGLNRWKVLSLIARCLEELDVESGVKGELSIYSLNELTIKQLTEINIPGYSKFRGSLNTVQLNFEKNNADILIHVESFDRVNKHITRLSVSTKISEYLASRRCIFAVGPPDVASIEYLLERDLAVVVTSKSNIQIKAALKNIMIDAALREKYADKGLDIARLRHSAEGTTELIYKNVHDAVMS